MYMGRFSFSSYELDLTWNRKQNICIAHKEIFHLLQQNYSILNILLP